MRHLKAGNRLGVNGAHRRAMLRNLVTSLVEHEQIRTTEARAKEMRTSLDRMITLGKKGDLNSRRRALAFIQTKEAMAKLFGEFAERYANRPGGFSRIIKMGPRVGDGAQMVLIQLIDGPKDPFAEDKAPKKKKAPAKKKAAPKAAKAEEAQTEEVVAEVAEEAAPKAETEAPAEEAAKEEAKGE